MTASHRLVPLVLLLGLATGCATTRLRPNERIEKDHVVLSGNLSAPGFFLASRVGASVTWGRGWGDLGLMGGETVYTGLELAGTARWYLGRTNLAVALGLVGVDRIATSLYPPNPGFDLRWTTVSDSSFPFYAGLQASGVMAWQFWATPPWVIFGAMVGWEQHFGGFGLQLELAYYPLLVSEEGVGFPWPDSCVDVCLGPESYLQLGVGLHFDVGG